MNYSEKNREYVDYIKLHRDIGQHNELRIALEYVMGGMNYFSGNVTKRGYRLVVKPIRRTVLENGHTITSSMLLGSTQESGLAFPIEEAPRYSAKRLKELAGKITNEHLEKIRENWEEQSYTGIDNFIKNIYLNK